jgi:uncharacterized protein YraI
MWRRLLVALVAVTAFTVAMTPQPAAAQGVVWNGDYYSNPTLQGSPTFSRQYGAIAFNWGSGSPGNGIDNDNFSVRWATDASLQAGTYRFYVLADDDVRVTVDFQMTPLIDTFNQNQVGQLVQRDISLGNGTHHIQVDYRELTSNAFVFVSFANLANNPQGPNFAQPVNLPVAGGAWTAQYYPNISLSGSPTLIQSESTPTHNWGNGSPAPSIPNDSFSARWTSLQTLAGGQYQVSATADDGVRVYIDGQAVIDQWHVSSGQQYVVDVLLTAGQHNLAVEYFEATGLASLDFNFTQTTTVIVPPAAPTAAPPVSIPAGASAAYINTGKLNVRAAPDPINGTILTKVNKGETYQVVGRNFDGSWVQLNVNGTIGWVNAAYVILSGAATLPVNSGNPTNTGYFVTATPYAVWIRSAPSNNAQILDALPLGASAQVVGRDATGSWWQINYGVYSGWVAARLAVIQGGANINAIPITG